MRNSGALLIGCGLLVANAAAAGEYREVPVTNGGTIAGSVRLAGAVPVLPPQPVFKQLEQCGDAVADERLVVGAGGALRNTVVALVDVSAGKAVPRERPVVLDNLQCAFVPHVLSATLGQTLDIRNSDPFLHDAHAWIESRTIFNVAVPKGRTVHQMLTDAGVVHINCNVRHTWMHAYLYVANHPYHGVTDYAGHFSIDAVPPGTYTLRVWHELLGSVDRSVTVEAGKTVTIDVELAGTAPEAR